ncbi:MAG: SDR family oxidoreductase [Actinomycetota bacterium]
MSTTVVTGSASGIGAACVVRFGADGHRVIGVDQRDADVIADLSTSDGRREAIDAVTRMCGGSIDRLVTCAGLSGATERPGAPLVSVNYFGTVELLAGLRPLLAAGTEPAAVAISSNSTTTQPGFPMEVTEACLVDDETRARALADEAGSFPTYPATKTAIARWVRRHAPTDDWIGTGIRLNAVAPGVTLTPMVVALASDPIAGQAIDMFPLPIKRPAQPEEIAGVIAFLLSRDAGFFVGSVVFVDGGTDALLRPDDWPSPFSNEAAAAFFNPPPA